MKQSHQKCLKSLNDAIYKNASYGLIQKQLHYLLSQPENIEIVNLVCTELQKSFTSKFSEIINRATYIFADLAYLTNSNLTQRMAQKKFQDNLLYTLRRKTSLIGNKFTFHPQNWQLIQTRVLKVYEFWAQKYNLEDQKLSNILKNYNYLKNKKQKFTQNNTSSNIKIEQKPNNKIIQLMSEQQKQNIHKQLQIYQNMIQNKQIQKLLDQQNSQYIITKYKLIVALLNQKSIPQDEYTKLRNIHSHLVNIIIILQSQQSKSKNSSNIFKILKSKILNKSSAEDGKIKTGYQLSEIKLYEKAEKQVAIIQKQIKHEDQNQQQN